MHLRFGAFSLDTGRRQLFEGGEERPLSPKAFELLLLLIENRSRATSKAEVHRRLWPDTFVSDATLTSLVAEVRAALGESARGGGFVRTVHRYGYAFNGTVAGSLPSVPDDRARCWIV
jgi:DNA-binding winged helix-turn-helix (wHTH) protein